MNPEVASQPMSMIAFQSSPLSKNLNPQIEESFVSAFRRIAPAWRTHRCSVGNARDSILTTKPRLIVGVGSVAFDSVDYSAIWRAAKQVGAVLVYWMLDDPYEIDFKWKIEGKCDWIFTTDRASVDYYKSAEVSHLPLAADIITHFRELAPLPTRLTDVFFCGYAYPNRLAIINGLRELLEVRNTVIRGDGWNERLGFCKNERIDTRKIAEHYSSSKLVINLGREFNIANSRYHISPSTPGPRTFEAAAAGCVQAYFLDTTEIFDYFDKDEEIKVFSSVTEFSRIMDDICSAPEHFEKVAAAAQTRTKKFHTYDNRAKQLLAVLRGNGLIQGGSDYSNE